MNNNTQNQVKKRQLHGTVVSDKMDKTCVVEVVRIKKHPKYLKHFETSRRFKAHDPENKCKMGDQATIEASRPHSKEKRWQVVESTK